MSLNDYKTISLLYSNDYGQIDKVKFKENDSIFLMKRTNKKYLKYKNENQTIGEIEKLNSINHQNLAEYKTFFFDKNNFYILMEYDDESELKGKVEYNIKNHLSFEENYLWSLTIQLLNLLKFIQENPEIDFNFTSINILLMNNGTLKIYDYSKNYKKLIYDEDSWIMDIFTLPPEILKDRKNIDKNAVNIWKAGCIIYELCTLHPPFDGNNAKEIALKILEGKYEQIGVKYSNDFNILLSKMLIVDPKKRATATELLSYDIIKKRNVEIEDIKINSNLFTFKKTNFKVTLRQKKSQREMMENDKFEIMKFTLSQKNIENNENIESTGHFNFNEKINCFDKNEFNNDDFKQRIIEENKKKGIIENNNFNYNNPYRNNNNLNIKKKNSESNAQNLNKKNKINNNNINFDNKKHQKIECKNKPINKPSNKFTLKNDKDNLSENKKERQKTPNEIIKKNNFFEDENDNKKHFNNKFFKNDKNKKIFLAYPKDNKININSNIKVIKSNEIRPNINIKNNKNDIKEKTEQILNVLNRNKVDENKIKIKAKIVKKNDNKNNNDKKNKFPMLSKMYNHPKDSYADKIINQIINKNNNKNQKKKIIYQNNLNNNKNNLFFNYNYENNNLGENIINNNYKLYNNPINPIIKPANHLPSFTYGKNNQIKIEYGVIKFNSNNNRQRKRK